MGTHLRLLSESSPINTNMTAFRWFSKLVLWTKVASVLEGLRIFHKFQMTSRALCVSMNGREEICELWHQT